jgi:hypothetical protein
MWAYSQLGFDADAIDRARGCRPRLAGVHPIQVPLIAEMRASFRRCEPWRIDAVLSGGETRALRL